MLQPLDRSVFGPFSKAYDRACTEFLPLVFSLLTQL
jgi:hypothetical protein